MIATELKRTELSPEEDVKRGAAGREGRRIGRAVILIGGIALLSVGTYLRMSARAAGTGVITAPPAAKVTVAAVEERTLIDQHELLGRVEAMESVEIRARVSGHIEE